MIAWQKLLMIFSVHVQTCDDLEDEESLKHLYHIMKGAIMLNSNRRPLPLTLHTPPSIVTCTSSLQMFEP